MDTNQTTVPECGAPECALTCGVELGQSTASAVTVYKDFCDEHAELWTLNKSGRYSADEKATMIERQGEGISWAKIGEELSRSPEGLQRTAHRMRERGEWPDDKTSVRELPRGPGRPSNRKRSRKVSPRLSSDVSTAIRAVAKHNGMRLGQLASVAVQRYLGKHGRTAPVRKAARHAASECEVVPHGETMPKLSASPREEVNSFSILLTDHVAIEAVAAKRKVYTASAIADAIHKLLADLGYKIEGCE